MAKRLELPDLTRAVCHPKRPHAEKGLCRQCLEKTILKDPSGPPSMVRRQARELMELHKAAGRIEALEAETKAILRENGPKYAEMHMQAAAVAAEKGDARPMEWALQHVKFKDAPIVEPPAKEPMSTGVRVFVGIQMGGVPTESLPMIQVVNPVDGPPESV